MASGGYSREARLRWGRPSCSWWPSPPWGAGAGGREGVELVPVGLPPRSLLDRLVADLQSHLDEMEKMRLVLVDAYPRLGCWVDDGGPPKARPGPGGVASPPSPTAAAAAAEEEGEEEGCYRLSLDVSGFAPEELSVKVAGRRLTVSAKRERRSQAPDGCLSHEYREVRKELLLPDDADLRALRCAFAPEQGRLRLRAPRLALPQPEERLVPIALERGPGGAQEDETAPRPDGPGPARGAAPAE